MAYKDTQTLRRAIGLLAVYNTLIYLPLLFTFICARALLPNLAQPDEVMPRLALNVASPWLGGLILTAPFGAVMATVSAFLVQISSALTQDVYHRHINPQASERQLRLLSQFSIVVVALCAAVGAIYSPKFLQAIIVFAGGSAACAFLVPALMAAFWARATAQGALAAMLGGVLTMLLLYLPGWLGKTRAEIGEPSGFAPYYLFGMAPFVWGLCVSAILGMSVSFWGGKPTNATQSATN
jgi:sodium/pantothenate symporter